ncbi:MAG: class I SAM-dependent methyltransferase [Gemmatimonadaceae bacterium]
MNWTWMRIASWIDTRAKFVDSLPERGRLLDLGSSDGGTLRHFAELRPDLALAAGDIEGRPEAYPRSTDFRRSDFDRDPLPWSDGLFDGVTCMHVVEHLKDPSHLMREAFRVLAPEGKLYVETPAPETVNMKSATGSAKGRVTVNFFDDPTHLQPVPVEELTRMALDAGFDSVDHGVSRNLIFTAAYPVLRMLRPGSRHRYVAQLHWTGWSVYVIARKRGRHR